MENKITYTRLGDLVGDSFTVEDAGGYTFKRWNAEAKRMETSEKYQEGFRKMYTVDTDKGRMDLGSGQLGQLLELTYSKGQANITGRTFSVKSNGKTGMDIRYFFSVKYENNTTNSDGEGFRKFQEARNKVKDEVVLDDIVDGEPIDLSMVPF